MLLRKSDKGRNELKPGVRTLGVRERGLLLVMDGSKTLQDINALFSNEAEAIALTLLRDGYLEQADATGVLFNPDSTGTFAMRTGVFMAATLQSPPPAVAQPPAAAPAPAGADSFDGKRSLATTRMFLFDICERMFARRDKVLAERFREALRNAKDRESMLAAAREMIAEIESAAGPERADSISERIAMLLPAEAAA